jgi:calcium-dependent protein kinase
MKTKAGTVSFLVILKPLKPYYISPEVLTGSYDMSCDMWSAGCILYILLCGYPPFYGDDDQEILRNVKKGGFDFDGEEWDDVSNEAKDLIKKLICKPERRLTAGEALQHHWIKSLAKTAKFEKLNKINVDSLKKFQHHQKLKQAALTAIAVHINPKDVKYLKDMFKALDKNGDGSLQLEELRQGLADIKNGDEILALM